MQPRMRTLILAGAAALGVTLGAGAGNAKAQVFVNTPGFSLGVGAPLVRPPYAAYGYPVAPVVPLAPVYSAYPVVRPYPYVVARPYYGYGYGYGRPYYGPRYHGYRRW